MPCPRRVLDCRKFVVGAWLGYDGIAVIRIPPLYQVRAFILPARRSKEREASAYSTCSFAFLGSCSSGSRKPMIAAAVKRSCSSSLKFGSECLET